MARQAATDVQIALRQGLPNSANPHYFQDKSAAKQSEGTGTPVLSALEALQKSVHGEEVELEYRVQDGVAIVSLGLAESRLSAWGTDVQEHRLEPHVVLALSCALDKAETDPSVFAVVLTAEGKFWCNGFDLKWIQAHIDLANTLQESVELLCARILQYPKPTIAAVNGHATAAGAMLMLCCDFRIMNKDKGFVFVPGIDLGLVYSPGMSSLMAAKLPQQMHVDFIVYGQRYTAKTLEPHGVVEAAPADEVLTKASHRAHALKGKTKHPATMARIKQTLYHQTIAALEHHPDLMFLQPSPMGFEDLPRDMVRLLLYSSRAASLSTILSLEDMQDRPAPSDAPLGPPAHLQYDVQKTLSVCSNMSSGASHSSPQNISNEICAAAKYERISGLRRLSVVQAEPWPISNPLF